MNIKRKTLLLAGLILCLSCPFSHADEVYTFVVKKQEAKAKSRWSLSEWLETRDRMRLMDLWLALHSPSPYEFFLGGAFQIGSLDPGGSYSGSHFEAAAYASIFGLGIEREAGPDTRWSGLFHLRLFGFHYQATHIRFEAGLRQEEFGALTFRNALVGGGMVVYLAKHFGVEGLYRHAFAATPNAAGAEFVGNRFEGGAFIDFSFLRIYGRYLYEKLDMEASSLQPLSTRSGPQVGLKVFF